MLQKEGRGACLSLSILSQFTLLQQKITKNQYFYDSGSFNVIDVDISKKLVTSACYDKQHVCAYLQLFSR